MLLGEGRYGSGKASWTTALILMPFLDETESFKRVGLWNSSVRGQSKLWVGAKKEENCYYRLETVDRNSTEIDGYSSFGFYGCRYSIARHFNIRSTFADRSMWA
jgi:hypothetical protein